MSRFAPIAAFAACLVFAVSAQAGEHTVTAGALQIVHPWSRATPGGARTAAGYLSVTNTGSVPDTLVSVSADTVAAKAEVHEVTTRDGVMSMKEVPGGVAVPASGTLTLKPGAYHIMFTGLKRPLKQGETFPGSLTFEKAGKVDVEFTVEAAGATAPSMPGTRNAPSPDAPMGGMDHMHMDH